MNDCYHNYLWLGFASGSVGVDTDGPQSGTGLPEAYPAPGDYYAAIRIGGLKPGAQSEWEGLVQYGKFAYAQHAVLIEGGYPSSGLDSLVGHSVFRSNKIAVDVNTYGTAARCRIQNCLFVGLSSAQSWGVGVRSYYAVAHNLSVTNCTFDGFSRTPCSEWAPYVSAGIVFKSTSANKVCLAMRNIFSHCVYGLYADGNTQGYTVDYNGLHYCTYYTYPSSLAGPHVRSKWDEPFEGNANGSYYLKFDASQNRFQDYGDVSAAEAGLSTRTTTAATVGNGRVKTDSILQSETWSLIERDNDSLVDLGYHYDPVDIVIQPSVSSPRLYVAYSPTVLTVVPGLTVAFSHAMPSSPGDGVLVIYDGARLDMRGTGSTPIRVSSSLSCGDNIGAGQTAQIKPGTGPLYEGIWFYIGAASPSWIQYVTFEQAAHAIKLWAYNNGLGSEILGCRFGGCDYGVYQTGMAPSATIRNCLFRNTRLAGVFSEAYGYPTDQGANVFSCTFAHSSQKAIFLTNTAAPTHQVCNCIFTDNGEYAIYSGEGQRPSREDHNCFSPNYHDANFTTDTATDLDANPLFVNTIAPDLYARFFLNDRSSPCNDAGDTSVLIVRLADFTTWRTGSADRGRVDIGYHYGPVCAGSADGASMGIAGLDSDGDHMDDYWEIFFFGSVSARSGNEDDDGDGLTTLQEYQFKSNPLVSDKAVRLYRNDAYTSPITDWDEWPGHYRQSPRFVFASDDPIYIEVRGIQQNPAVQESFTDEIKVTSEADPTTAVYITVTETGANTNIFRSTNEPLYVSTCTISTSLPGGGHKIKIVDEEKLAFRFQTIAAGVTREVLVDRGEFAGCGIDIFYGGDPYWGDRQSLLDGAAVQCCWFCSGDKDFPNNIDGFGTGPMAIFIRNAGDNLVYSRQTDLLHIVCHSEPNGTLYDDYRQIIFDPDNWWYGIDVNREWNADLEWILIHACSALTDEPPFEPPGERPGYKHWKPTLGGIPRQAHGLLGGDAPLDGIIKGAIAEFWDRLDPAGTTHATFLEAFQIAMTNYKTYWNPTGQPWACYYHISNERDKLDEVTPDSDEENPLCRFEDFQGTSFTEHLRDQQGMLVGGFDGGKCLVKIDFAGIAADGISLPRTLLARKVFPSVRTDFPVRGCINMSPRGNVLHIGNWKVAGRICSYTPEQAEALAKAFVEKELPTIADRIWWLPASTIRWGEHRENEPLILRTGGYVVVGQLCYAGMPLLYDAIQIAILGDTIEYISITCHEVEEIAKETVKVVDCRTAIEHALPDVKKSIGVGDKYAIIDARLVYVGALEPCSEQAQQGLLEYKPMWTVVFHMSPDGYSCGNIRIAFIDAISGKYLGYVAQ